MRALTIEEIKDRLKKMVVNNKDILPLRVFSLLVKNPQYDIKNFSQEIEDSETEIDVMKEIVTKMKEPGFDLVWNNTLHQVKTNSPEWVKNHGKKCPILLVPNAIFASCVNQSDGTRHFCSEEIINKFEHLMGQYGEIYDFC